MDIRKEDLDELVQMMSPWQAVDRLVELVGFPLWSDSEWLPYEVELKERFVPMNCEMVVTPA